MNTFIKNCNLFYFIYFLYFFKLLTFALDHKDKKNNFIESNKYQNYSFYLRKTHPIELTIESGSIRGEYLTIGVNDFAVFKGIPYAAPPVGSLRFQKPAPPARWRGVMNATQYPPMCAQLPRTRFTDPLHLFKIHVSEDCLYLNVFAPPQFNNDTYPVIVWIHGGGFQSGSSSDYQQEAILKHFVSRKVVFVSMNYRLGPLGFLSTGDNILPGNNGLHDLILALKWIQTNIRVFGGTPENVLLMGQGFGASAASILALSPKGEGLFHRVLLMSGTALNPNIVRHTAINATWALDKQLHCRSYNSSELLDCFKKQLRDEILNFEDDESFGYHTFVPVIDGEGGIIPDPPEVMAQYRKTVPIMLGTTKDESSLNMRLTVNDIEELAENLTKSYSGFVNQELITEGCKNTYIWTKINPANNLQPILTNSLLDMHSNFWYDAPTSRLATYYAKQKVPVYLYSFDHVSENFMTNRAFHGCDEIYLFNIEPRFLKIRKDKNWQLDRRVTEIFVDLIVNFLKFGNPTPENSGFLFNWTIMTSEKLDYLEITDSPTLKVGFRWEGHIFWNKYVPHLDSVDVGQFDKISQLDKQLADYQLATWMLLFCALFFFAILVGLACYCTRKESEDDDL